MKKKQTPLRRLAGYAKPYIGWYALIFITMLLSTAVVLLRPKIIQVLIDGPLTALQTPGLSSGEADAQMTSAVQLGLLYLATIVFHFFVMYAAGMLTQRTGVYIVTDMRQQIYDHVLRLPMTYFDHHAIGSIVTRVTNDTESVLDLYTYVLTNLFRNLVLFFGILAMLFSLNLRLAILVTLLTPFVMLVAASVLPHERSQDDRQAGKKDTCEWPQ